MRFRIEQHLPGPLAAVEQALFDPAFIARLGTLPKLGAPQLLEREVDGVRARHRVRYRFAGELSPAVTRFIEPDRLTWVEETVLDRVTHRAVHRILPDHYEKRLECGYTTRLLADGRYVRRVAEGDVTVHVPLVGGKAERAIVTGLEEHAALEAAALREWMAEAP